MLSNENRKNQKLVIVPIKSRKDIVTESRSNKKEGSILSINEELQLDTSFTQGNLKKNGNTSNKKDKGK